MFINRRLKCVTEKKTDIYAKQFFCAVSCYFVLKKNNMNNMKAKPFVKLLKHGKLVFFYKTFYIFLQSGKDFVLSCRIF